MKITAKNTFKLILFILFISLAIFNTIYTPHTNLKAINGLLDLSSESFESKDYYSVNDFFVLDNSDNDFFYYHLNINLPETLDEITIRVPAILNDFTLTANNQCLYSYNNSQISQFYPEIYTLSVPTHELNLTLTVKDVHSFFPLSFLDPTYTNDFFVGNSDAIYRSQKWLEYASFFIVSLCCICCIYHIFSLYYKPSQLGFLYLIVFDFSTAFSVLTNNQGVIHYFLPSISIAAFMRIHYIALIASNLALIAFIKRITRIKHNIHAYFIIIIALCSLLIASFTMPIGKLFFLFPILISIMLASVIGSLIGTHVNLKNYTPINAEHIFVSLIALLLGVYTEIIYMIGSNSYFSLYEPACLTFIIIHSIYASIEYHISLKRINKYAPMLKNTLDELQNNPSTYINTHIKPTFLYETLDSIKHYIDTDTDRVEELIQALAKYLRQALDFSISHDTYPLKKELENCQAYGTLISEQHNEIKFDFEYDEELPDTLIPQQAILALLENSVSNAFTGILHPQISVTAIKDNDLITITITDNGIGMTSEEIDHALNVPSQNLNICINYINEQLKKNFNSSLKIHSVINKGTSIRFSVPIQEVTIYE